VGDKRAASLREVRRYLALALRFTEPRTVAVAGAWVLGCGQKHAVAGADCQRGVVRVRADVERKRLFGLAPQASSAAVRGGIYTAEASQRTHERLAQAGPLGAGCGHTVLVDATFLNPAMRQRFMALATQAQVPCRILSFEAPLAVLRERVRSRQLAGGDASEASLAGAGIAMGGGPAALARRRGADGACGHHPAGGLECAAAARRWQHAGYNASCPGMKYSSTLVMTR
jgi:predicted kinase